MGDLGFRAFLGFRVGLGFGGLGFGPWGSGFKIQIEKGLWKIFLDGERGNFKLFGLIYWLYLRKFELFGARLLKKRDVCEAFTRVGALSQWFWVYVKMFSGFLQADLRPLKGRVAQAC